MASNQFLKDYNKAQRPPWKSSRLEDKPSAKVHGMTHGSSDKSSPELRGAYYSKLPPVAPYDSSNTNRHTEHDLSNHKRVTYDIPPKIPKDVWGTSSALRTNDSMQLGGQERAEGVLYRDLGPSLTQTKDRNNPLSYSYPLSGYNDNAGRSYNKQMSRSPYLQSMNISKRGLSSVSGGKDTYNMHRPHDNGTLVVPGPRDNFDSKEEIPAGRESLSGDIELRNVQHTNNSLLDGYQGSEFPSGEAHHRGPWRDTSHQDIMSLRFLAEPRNAESFIEGLVESCIKESLILEVAVEVLVESKELQDVIDQSSHPVILAAKDILHDCINEELVAIAREGRQQAVTSFWKDIVNKTEIMDPVGDMIVMETVENELKLVAADAICEMVEDYFVEKEVVNVFDVLYDEVSGHLLYEIVNETLLDLSMDAMFEELVDEETREVASIFVIDLYATGCPRLPLSDRKAQAEDREICEVSTEYASDILILESLLKSLQSRNQRWTDAEYLERTLDGLIFDQLLSQSLMIQDAVDKTQQNAAFKQFHDDTADETGMQFLLDEMIPSLDDDMARQDQIESELAGLMDTPSTAPTPQ